MRVTRPQNNKEISLERQEPYFGHKAGQGNLETRRSLWDYDPTSTGIEGDLVTREEGLVTGGARRAR